MYTYQTVSESGSPTAPQFSNGGFRHLKGPEGSDVRARTKQARPAPRSRTGFARMAIDAGRTTESEAMNIRDLPA
jgi:hypothetical protein